MPSLRRHVRRAFHRIVRDSRSGTDFALIGDGRWEQRFAELLFDRSASVQRFLRPSLGSWTAVARRLAAKHGVVVVSGARFKARPPDHLLRQPAFVAMRLPLRESEAVLLESLPRSARSDIKRTTNRGFTVEVTSDPAWAAEYFERFHRPTITGRHGEDGFVMEPEAMAKTVASGAGEFIRLYHEEKLVAALLNARDGDTYHLLRVGWLDGADEIRRLGVISALDWYALRRARTLGCTQVQFGGTPPFVHHGIFQYKSKWGAAMDLSESVWGHYWLQLDLTHPTARALVERCALVIQTDEGLAVLSGGTPQEAKVTASLVESMCAWYQLRERVGPPSTGLPPDIAIWFDRHEPCVSNGGEKA